MIKVNVTDRAAQLQKAGSNVTVFYIAVFMFFDNRQKDK
jgi:hypothetical protein